MNGPSTNGSSGARTAAGPGGAWKRAERADGDPFLPPHTSYLVVEAEAYGRPAVFQVRGINERGVGPLSAPLSLPGVALGPTVTATAVDCSVVETDSCRIDLAWEPAAGNTEKIAKWEAELLAGAGTTPAKEGEVSSRRSACLELGRAAAEPHLPGAGPGMERRGRRGARCLVGRGPGECEGPADSRPATVIRRHRTRWRGPASLARGGRRPRDRMAVPDAGAGRGARGRVDRHRGVRSAHDGAPGRRDSTTAPPTASGSAR